jgi:hypothetical protein
MSLSLRALATNTSWPHSSKSRLTQGEWVPVSMAMRTEGSEAKRRLRASDGAQPTLLDDLAALRVDEAQIGVLVAEIQSGCHLWLYFATIHGGPILLPIGPLEPVYCLQTQGYCVGGRPSHPIFRERRLGEVSRIYLLRTPVNKPPCRCARVRRAACLEALVARDTCQEKAGTPCFAKYTS